MQVTEFKERPNTHQLHLEQLVTQGPEGLEELNDKIEKFITELSGKDTGLNTTVKIDGAPAVVIFSKFPGYPDNSICLKSFITSNKNCLSSKEEIQAKYGDRPGMAEKLLYCLQLAPSIPANEAWQGDCLYSKDDLKEREIKGTRYLTFHPNKIIYAFSEDNPTYETIKNSDFGICFHTIYKASGEGKKTQSFRVDAKRLNNVPDNIYVMSPALNKSTNKADYNIDEVLGQYDELKKIESQLLSNSDYEDLCDNSVFMSYWNTFENANLSDKRAVNINVDTFFDELCQYIKDKQEKEYNKKLSTLKTDAGKQKAHDKYEAAVIELEDILTSNREVLTLLVKALNLAANIKMNLWNGFKKADQGYNTFLKHKERGYEVTPPEGIAMSAADGSIVKIVDRSTFSNANRDPNYLSGFDHKDEDLSENAKIPVPDKEELYDLIYNKKYTRQKLANLYNTNTTTVSNWIKDYLKYIKDNYGANYLQQFKIDKNKNESLEEAINKYYRCTLYDTEEDKYISLFRGINEYLQELYDEDSEASAIAYDDLNSALNQLEYALEVPTDLDFNSGNYNFAFTKKAFDIYEDEFDELKWALNEYSPYELVISEVDVDDKDLVYQDDLQVAWKVNESLEESHESPDEWSEELFNVPDKLYHATYGAYLDKIREEGIKPGVNNNWGFSNPVICLSPDLDEAGCFAEAADEISDKVFNTGVYVLEIDTNKLDKDHITKDKNTPPWYDDDEERWYGVEFEYDKVIPFDAVNHIIDYSNYQIVESTEPAWVKNTVNTVQNTDKDPNVIATKEYHKMKVKKTKKGQMVTATPGLAGAVGESLEEDTKKKADGKWVNKGDDGEHGEFKTKKEADAQRKAMFANGYHEELDEAADKTAVVAFGRMNPPTISHNKLVDVMAAQDGDSKLYLSHSVDSKKNPLLYHQKLAYADEAFGDKVEVVRSQARTLIQALQELYNDGYKNIIYVGGEDRIGGDEDVTKTIERYNGQPDKQGNLLYDFDSIKFINAGARNANSEDPIESASASKARELARNNDLEGFKAIVPFKGETAEDLFADVRLGLGLKEDLCEAGSDTSANAKFEQDVTDNLSDKSTNKALKFERQGGNSLVSDIKCENIKNKNVFFIECKMVPAQAGEIRCTIRPDGSLVKNESGYKDPEDKELAEFHAQDMAIMNEIVDLFNSEEALKAATSNNNKEININISKYANEDVRQMFLTLMMKRIILHYKFLGADYLAIGKTAENAQFCKLDDMWDAMILKELRLRQKLTFSYSVDISKLRKGVGKFLKTHFGSILYKGKGINPADGFIENYIKNNRLLFYSEADGKIPANIYYDDNCRQVRGHTKCIAGDIAFDITEDREGTRLEADTIKVGRKTYKRFAVRYCPNRSVISFLATVDINKNSNVLMSYNEFLRKIK